MSRKLEETLGLPSMESLIGDYDDDVDFPIAADFSLVSPPSTVDEDIAALGGADHAKKMDELFVSFKNHGEAIFDLAQDIEVVKAARMFEVANAVLKNAMDAQNSKRDSQLKTMKFKLDQQRLEFEKRNAGLEPAATIQAEATVFMDRNSMLKKLRERAAEENKDDR